MKKIILSALFALAILVVKGQNDIQFGSTVVGKQKPGFYKTYEDLLNDKIEYLGELDERITIEYFVRLGGKAYKFKELDYYGFKDTHGNRFRIIKGVAYNMICAGKICFYTKSYNMNSIDNKTKKITRGFTSVDFRVVYYSAGSTGALVEISKYRKASEVANILFKDDELIKGEYLNDQNDDLDPDCKNCETDDMERIIFYVNKYNAAHK